MRGGRGSDRAAPPGARTTPRAPCESAACRGRAPVRATWRWPGRRRPRRSSDRGRWRGCRARYLRLVLGGDEAAARARARCRYSSYAFGFDERGSESRRASSARRASVEAVDRARRHLVDELEQIGAVAVDRIGPDAVAGAESVSCRFTRTRSPAARKCPSSRPSTRSCSLAVFRVDLLVLELDHRRGRADLQRGDLLQLRHQRVGQADR